MKKLIVIEEVDNSTLEQVKGGFTLFETNKDKALPFSLKPCGCRPRP